MVTYRALGDVPRQLVAYLAGLLAAERRTRGTRNGTRALSCWTQAVFALVWFRERRPIPLIGKGMGISQPTSYRYLTEAIDVLARPGPRPAPGAVPGGRRRLVPRRARRHGRRLRPVQQKTTSRKGTTIDAGIPAKRAASAATSRR